MESYDQIQQLPQALLSWYYANRRELPWRQDIASLNYILSSNVWQQDHNGFTHQDPGFLDHLANKKADVVRLYLPPDANCLLSCFDHCVRSKNYINVMVASKHPRPQWLTMEQAVKHCTQGIGIWQWASNDQWEEPDIILVYLGTNDFTRDYPNIGTVEALDYAKAEAAAKAGSIQAETVYEAYAMMLYKITQRYPKAKLYCMTIMPRRVHPVPGREDYSRYGQPTAYNAGLRSIAEHLGCTVIDLEHCGIPNDGPEYDYYIADQGLHPGKNGMEMIAKTVIRTMLGSFHSLQG